MSEKKIPRRLRRNTAMHDLIHRLYPHVTVLNVPEHEAPRLTSKAWRQLLHKVWKVDPLVCPRYGAKMILVVIEDPSVIRRNSLPDRIPHTLLFGKVTCSITDEQ